MLGIANYTMKGPLQALIAVCAFSVLSVWVAPLGLFVGAIIALVTLRVSISEGFKTLAWAVISHMMVSIYLSGSYWPGIIAVIEYMLPVWVMSVILRQTNSIAAALQFAMVLAGAAVLTFHLMVPNPADWWLTLFNEHIAPVLAQSNVEYQAEAIKELASLITMLIGIFAVILWFSILIIARWWQSELYYPGQFKTDFYQLRLTRPTAYAAIALAVLGLILGDDVALIQDLSSVIIVGLMIQGIAIAHHTVSINQLHTAWLVTMYVLLFIFPQTMLILATIGLIDSWMDFRNRWDKES